MGRQFRSARAGQTSPAYVVTSASSTVATVPTGGLAILSTVVGADFTLAPPEVGVRTFLYVTLVTTAGLAVRACPKGGTGSFSSTAADCVLKFDRAGSHVVSLLGITTAEWCVTSVTPKTTEAIVITTTF